MGMGSKNITSCENMRKLRRAIGLTQEELAVELKIKRSLLGAYEEHRAEVQPEAIKKCIDKGYLLKSQLYDFMFNKKFRPTPTKHYKKVLISVP